eukprot:11179951-Lingulodinium_polyedra.AAC.1
MDWAAEGPAMPRAHRLNEPPLPRRPRLRGAEVPPPHRRGGRQSWVRSCAAAAMIEAMPYAGVEPWVRIQQRALV